MGCRTAAWVLLCVVLSGAGALNVDIPQQQYEYARGDSITLPCRFQPKVPLKASDIVIISWSAKAAKVDAKETQILTYYAPRGKFEIKSSYEGRVSLDVNVLQGKADLKLSSITLADNMVFECRVLIPGDDEGRPGDVTRLVVLAAPSPPVCNIQGKVEYNQNITLTCESEEGIPSPTYRWERRDVRNMSRIMGPEAIQKGGVLSLFKISRDTSGYYICTARNKVHFATCTIILSVMPPSVNLGSTAGIMAGVASWFNSFYKALLQHGAANVEVPNEEHEGAESDSVILPCRFQPKAPHEVIVISWSVATPKADAKEDLVLSYISPVAIMNVKPLYQGHVSFNVNITLGKADLKLSSITLADNKVFQCRVQFVGQVETEPAVRIHFKETVGDKLSSNQFDGTRRFSPYNGKHQLFTAPPMSCGRIRHGSEHTTIYH
ncbi:uncharacterized protein V6R79_022205 [Siganus canaliculatus]